MLSTEQKCKLWVSFLFFLGHIFKLAAISGNKVCKFVDNVLLILIFKLTQNQVRFYILHPLQTSNNDSKIRKQNLYSNCTFWGWKRRCLRHSHLDIQSSSPCYSEMCQNDSRRSVRDENLIIIFMKKILVEFPFVHVTNTYSRKKFTIPFSSLNLH